MPFNSNSHTHIIRSLDIPVLRHFSRIAQHLQVERTGQLRQEVGGYYRQDTAGFKAHKQLYVLDRRELDGYTEDKNI
jgi:hypothetical protein